MTMSWKTNVIATAAAFAVLGFGPGLQAISPAHATECDASDHIDGSTADTARKMFLAAGYTSPHGYVKGCDNMWHALAVKDGNAVRVVAAPDGTVTQEGD